MALAYLIKRTGSWHVGLRAISHIQLDQFSIADVAVWTPYQRVFSSAPLTSPLTADDTIPPEPTQPKKEKSKNRYDLDAVHATAERVFDSRLEIETTTAESAAQTAGISDTLLHDYEEIVNEMDKKREKHPIKEFEVRLEIGSRIFVLNLAEKRKTIFFLFFLSDSHPISSILSLNQPINQTFIHSFT